jgi:catechol 2,3-dioxygenase-like lactoylglutathione lyase family enzyme
VARAVDRLRVMLLSRGAVMPVTALATVLWERAAEAAPASVLSLAKAVAAEHARLSILQLAKGAILMMAWQKARIAILSAAIVLFSGTLSVSLIHYAIAQNDATAKAPPSTAPAQPSLKITQVTPIVPVQDMVASLAFYTERLGFEILWEWGDPTGFAAIGRDGLTIFLSHEGQKPAGVGIYLTASDVIALHRDFAERGLTVDPPAERPWGMREMVVEDPDGNRLRIGSVFNKAQLPEPAKK